MLRDTYERAPSNSLLNRMLYLDWKLTLADNDLRKVNRMCELADIKVRYPLLDHDIVELSTRVPPSSKLKGLKLRYFYKNALKEFLPSEVINKSKHGFGLPFGEWLKTSPKLQELIYSSLHRLKLRKVFRDDFLDQLIETHRHGHAAYYGTMVWVLVMLEEWLQQHDASL
jgi:asparagine synthase (glutamine-hydrolysing)